MSEISAAICIRQPDINQPTFEQLRANIPPGPNVNVNFLRPVQRLHGNQDAYE